MHRTFLRLKNTCSKLPPIVDKPIVKRKNKFKLVPGRIRSPFHISYGGIYEGIYDKDSLIYDSPQKKKSNVNK